MTRILVAYASRSGTTAEVAAAIADQLRTRGDVDLRSVDEVSDLNPYDAVVLGSAIRMGKWLPQAQAFVDQHVVALRARPVAIFTVHLLAVDDSPASVAQRASYTAPVRAQFTPVDEAFFAGRMDRRRLGWGERLITKMMKAQDEDQRDLNAIRAWANALAVAA